MPMFHLEMGVRKDTFLQNFQKFDSLFRFLSGKISRYLILNVLIVYLRQPLLIYFNPRSNLPRLKRRPLLRQRSLLLKKPRALKLQQMNQPQLSQNQQRNLLPVNQLKSLLLANQWRNLSRVKQLL